MTESSRPHHTPDGQPMVETHFRVRYHETDAMGVVHHAAYLTWFEEGRSAFTRAIGYPYATMEAEGISLAVTEVHMRFHRPARYDDEVVVATCLTRFASRGMSFAYRVRRAVDGELLVTGTTAHVSIDRQGRVVRFPEEMRAKLAQGMA